MPDSEKEAARVFVSTMVPHIVETAIAGLESVAKVVAAEKKTADLLASAMSKQPTIVVKNVEAILAEATKRGWWCW
jgi:predicted aspartyl protease